MPNLIWTDLSEDCAVTVLIRFDRIAWIYILIKFSIKTSTLGVFFGLRLDPPSHSVFGIHVLLPPWAWIYILTKFSIETSTLGGFPFYWHCKKNYWGLFAVVKMSAGSKKADTQMLAYPQEQKLRFIYQHQVKFIWRYLSILSRASLTIVSLTIGTLEHTFCRYSHYTIVQPQNSTCPKLSPWWAWHMHWCWTSWP